MLFPSIFAGILHLCSTFLATCRYVYFQSIFRIQNFPNSEILQLCSMCIFSQFSEFRISCTRLQPALPAPCETPREARQAEAAQPLRPKGPSTPLHVVRSPRGSLTSPVGAKYAFRLSSCNEKADTVVKMSSSAMTSKGVIRVIQTDRCALQLRTLTVECTLRFCISASTLSESPQSPVL